MAKKKAMNGMKPSMAVTYGFIPLHLPPPSPFSAVYKVHALNLYFYLYHGVSGYVKIELYRIADGYRDTYHLLFRSVARKEFRKPVCLNKAGRVGDTSARYIEAGSVAG